METKIVKRYYVGKPNDLLQRLRIRRLEAMNPGVLYAIYMVNERYYLISDKLKDYKKWFENKVSSLDAEVDTKNGYDTDIEEKINAIQELDGLLGQLDNNTEGIAQEDLESLAIEKETLKAELLELKKQVNL